MLICNEQVDNGAGEETGYIPRYANIYRASVMGYMNGKIRNENITR